MLVRATGSMANTFCQKTSHIKYKDLFEGIGNQVVHRMLMPISRKTTQEYTAPSTFVQQLIGVITFLYCIFSICLLVGIFGVYLICPDKQEVILNMLALLIPGMVLFSLILVTFCFWVNKRNYLTMFNSTILIDNERCTSSHSSNSSNRETDSYLVPDNFLKKTIIQAPIWEDHYDDLQDPSPDYKQVILQQEKNKKHLEFLKYTD